MLGSLRLLLIAGIDTTWSAIGSSLWHLAKTPADRERLVAEPALIPTAVEELLRAYSPVTMAREVMKETTVISGCPVKAGNMVLLSFPAANRDPAMFPDADKVVIDRKENRHAAFGLGIHRCVGSNLARMEMTVAIEEWLKRIPDFRLDPAGQVTWSEGTVRGPRQLPLLFGKATLRLTASCIDRSWRPDVTEQTATTPATRATSTSPTSNAGSRRSSSARSAISSSGMISTPIRRSRCISRRRSFRSSDPVVQQLNAAVLFAATFLMRPLGGWLFGYIADRYGRRVSLTLSVVCMCFGSLIIAVTPTYASIGVAAPAILALARIIEGLSLGGEYGASATYLSEVADPRHRGFYSSFQYVTLIGGQLTAIIVLLLLQKVFLTPEELKQWGWRIPFVIGAGLAIFAAVMRRNLHETEAFVEAKKVAQSTGSIRGLLRYPRELLLVAGLTAGGTAAFYTFTTYMQTFVKLSSGLSEDQTTLVIFGSLIFATILQPVYGALSDRIGRKPLLIFFGIAGSVCTIPILTTLKATKTPFTAFLLICGAWIFVAGYTSINAVVKAELFPTNVRALGVGLPYAITVSLFGGTAPAIALYFKSLGHEDWFYYYLSGIIFLSLIIYASMRDTKHASAMHRHQ